MPRTTQLFTDFEFSLIQVCNRVQDLSLSPMVSVLVPRSGSKHSMALGIIILWTQQEYLTTASWCTWRTLCLVNIPGFLGLTENRHRHPRSKPKAKFYVLLILADILTKFRWILVSHKAGSSLSFTSLGPQRGALIWVLNSWHLSALFRWKLTSQGII